MSFLMLMFAGCTTQQHTERTITVTIEPQRYFAEQLVGDKFHIHCVVPAGQSPETYDPTPQQMIQIGQSEAYLQIGYIGFELAWMEKIRENNPQVTFFDTSEGFHLIATEEEHTHEHAGHKHHHHGAVDPHIWSSIAGAKAVALNMLNAIVSLDKSNEVYYRENYAKLLAEIEQTEQTISQLLSPIETRSFIIYHPALTYFAEEFNLMQFSIEMDGKEPSPAQLKELVETARAHRIHTVFIQQEFDQKNAELIAKETGCRLVTINPLTYEWSNEMIRIAKALSNE